MQNCFVGSNIHLHVSLPTRRAALSLLVGALLLTAGCSVLQNKTQSSNDVLLVNNDNTDHAVVVEIAQLSDSPDPVYATGRTLDAESQVYLEPFNETSEYVLTVTVDGTTTELTHTFESGGSVVNIAIDNEGEVSIT
jgi:hypothetical protein